MGVSGDIEEGRKRVSEAVEDKEETAKNLRKLVSPKRSQENGESSRRKRRSANSDDSRDEEVEVDAKTINEVCGKTKQTGEVKSVMSGQNCLWLSNDLNRNDFIRSSNNHHRFIFQWHFLIIKKCLFLVTAAKNLCILFVILFLKWRNKYNKDNVW